jgi:hypothetical protein
MVPNSEEAPWWTETAALIVPSEVGMFWILAHKCALELKHF